MRKLKTVPADGLIPGDRYEILCSQNHVYLTSVFGVFSRLLLCGRCLVAEFLLDGEERTSIWEVDRVKFFPCKKESECE